MGALTTNQPRRFYQRLTQRRGWVWFKLATRLLSWVLAAPLLSFPYFLAICWIASKVPNSTTVYANDLELLRQSAGLTMISALLLPYTAPLIGATTYFLSAWAKQYLGSIARFLLCTTVVGWVHCVGYIVLTELHLIELHLFN